MPPVRSLLTTGVLLAVATAAFAGRFPETGLFMLGYSKVEAADLAGTPHAMARRKDEDSFIAVSTDLDGDRRIDEVGLLRNDKERKVSVVATIRSKDQLDTYFLRTVPLSQLDRLAIRAERDGDAPRAVPDAPAAKSLRGNGLVVFDLGGGTADLYRFDGQRFVKTPIAAPVARREHRHHR